ncbi:MAG TPA: GPP34 family phosphoprotein [Gaiellaceae bacterium]|nr:GPP34 family phosphoprotein [Gaiellaceae bacterium]
MLLAEDLLLLLTDDRSGRLAVPANRADLALGAAMLVDLTLGHHVQVSADGRLLVLDGGATSDVLLDEALATVDRNHGRKPKDVLAPLARRLRPRLYERLVHGGLVREEAGRICGIFPRHRWPAADAAHENAVRADLGEALRAGATADARTGALVALLHALGAKVIDADHVGITRAELEVNAERIADGDWASEAVRSAIREMLAAIIAATTSATIARAG